jgi:DNA polymerase I-like protein with 3'-5' exonuclease and polymerase domains
MGLFDGIAGELLQRKNTHIRALPPIPYTGWKAPQEFPNLSSAVMISLDTETKDPELTTAGPGWARHKGHIVGVSLAAQARDGTQGKWYFPMRHEVCPEENLNPDNVLDFLRHYLGNPYTGKIGANLIYDLGWLAEENVTVRGPMHDIQFAEALIDNNAFVSLEILAGKYLGLRKDTDLLQKWIEDAYKPKKSAWRGDIYRAPPSLAGAYGEADAALPLNIIQRQWPIIAAEGLGQLYDIEHGLLPMIIKMRQKGVRVDVEAAHRMRHTLDGDIGELYQKVESQYGYRLVNTKGDESSDSRQIGKLLDHLGITYPRTKAGNPSIEKEWLDALEHPVGDLLKDIREHEKIKGTFVESYILQKNVNGFLYPVFHPLKGEYNGTAVGRFSSSDPNLQNIPSRTKLGKKVRTLFVPDKGHFQWRKHDYSQVHYRILAHNAVDRGDGSAEALRQRYINDPATDYHLDVYMKVAPLLGWSTTDEEVIKVKRRPIKNVNFGLLYGQSAKSLAYKAGFTGQQAEDFFAAYHAGAPYVKPTMDAIAAEAEQFGFVTTLLGRRIRFNMWEPRGYGNKAPALPYQQALKTYGTFIRLAFLYRAVNYKFQGSEPDIMKKGMLDCWNSGVFDYVGVPRLTVHDELDWSVEDDSPQTREAFAFIQRTMEQSIQLRVPLKVDATTGPNWGQSD